MSPRTEKQLEQIRENKIKVIIDTALELFANNGYYPTTISQIAKKAGISKGLIYNYFESKEHLIKTIMIKGVEDIYRNFDLNHDGILTSDELIFYIHETFKIIKENRQFWMLYFSTIVQPSVYKIIEPELLKFSEPIMKPFMNYFNTKYGNNYIVQMTLFQSLMKGAIISYVYSPELFNIDLVEDFIVKNFC
jgi:AcrR family transcriptional regulator